MLHAVAGTSSVRPEIRASQPRYVKQNLQLPRYNLNKIFEKPYVPQQLQKDPLFIPPQIDTYAASLNQDKTTYNHITRTYIDNLYQIQTYLNTKPRSTDTEPNTGYLTQKLKDYNRLIALPKASPKLVATCYHYGLLHRIYGRRRRVNMYTRATSGISKV